MMIELGIIGAGRMGNAHAHELEKLAGVRIAGVYDIKPEAAHAMHQQYGATIYQSAKALAEAPNINGVLICSPTYCHPEGVAAALQANKAIFCEKPLCRTKKDAEELLAAGRAANTIFAVGFVRRYMAKTLHVKKILAEGLLGKIRFCNVDLPLGIYKRMPGDWFTEFDLCGGVILDMLAHHVDLTNWFFGPVERVYADSLLLDKSQPEPADYVSSTITYRSGVIVNVMCNWQRFGRSGEMMEIYGENGAIVMDGSDDLTYYPKGKEKQVIPIDGPSGHQQQMKAFVAAIRGEGVPTATLQDGYNSLAVGLAMIESCQTHQVVEMLTEEPIA
ncbi:MAG TPA: Gfo/Idh/MocA family oxidoreductase [Armatimonadota bacterium]|nr:Gfo/Idh/MocA family oxidoreductase [Armatimonadota bacterium]